MRRLVLALLLAAACKEKTATVEGPPLTIASASAAPSTDAPVRASFVDLASAPPQTIDPCDDIVIDVANGHASVLGEELDPGDVLLAFGTSSVAPKGHGLAALALIRHEGCVASGALVLVKRVVRAGEAPELSWAGGAMRAHLDVEKDKLPRLYVGRLEGTAPVAEHTHDKSWEILFAVEAAGTFTLDGKPQRLGPRAVVTVPPNTKHSWAPDPGSKLVAIQMYSPPGPEQRFRALADAGK